MNTAPPTPPQVPSPADTQQRRTPQPLPSLLPSDFETQFFQTLTASPSIFINSCTGGWVIFFFSNFLLLFPVDLTFHAPGQVTHKPLPLSHQASKIFFFSFVEVALAGDPGEERQAGRRDLEQHLARQGFSCLPHTVQH